MTHVRDDPKNWITIKNLDKRFTKDGVLTLSGIELSIRKGEIICIVGPSGCGKTTLLNIVAGFESPSKGECLIGGDVVRGPGPERGFVFQKPALFPWMTVLKNATIGAKVRGERKESWRPRVEKLLRDTKLSGFEGYYPHQISGGMAQRVQLVRVLMNQPDVVLMDEPFGALDYQTRLSMHQLLLDIHQTYQPTIIFITHDVDEAIFLADRILVMKQNPGEIVREFQIDRSDADRSHRYALPEFSSYKREILELLGFH